MVRRNEYDLIYLSVEALCTAINKNNRKRADSLFKDLTKESVMEVLSWWESLYQDGDVEGLLVLVWLERHRFLIRIT